MRFVNNFTITVKKEDLLKALVSNRAQHAETYILGVKQYKLECLEILQQRIDTINADGVKLQAFLCFSVVAPKSYITEYDTVIGMLEMATEDEFTIDGSTYRAWVKDEWEWKDAFETNTVGYAIKARV